VQPAKKSFQNQILGSRFVQQQFLGIIGFRFPFVHFVTDSNQASELYGVFWKAVRIMYTFGLKVVFTSMNVAHCNRMLCLYL
jgi:hypothetical protein